MKRRFLYALLSLLIAIGLWIYVVTVISPESETTVSGIPVLVSGESVLAERGLMVTTQKLPAVTLTLYGNRSDLRKLNSSNIVLVLDVSRISEAGVKELTYSVSYPTDIPNGSVEILSQTPERISIAVTEKRSAKVPVQLEYIGKVPAQYVVDKLNAQLDYDRISVEGPKEVIEKIHHAKVEVDLTDRRASINQSFRYTLCDQDGNPVDVEHVVTNVAEVQLNLTIQMVKQLDLVVKVVAGGGATEENAVIKLEPSNIQVSGSEQLLEELSVLELGTIYLGDCMDGTVKTYDLTGMLPTGVTNLTGPNTVTATISFPGLVTRELKISNFLCQNVPTGLTVEILTQDITVKIRGPEAKVLNITEQNVTVFVNFAHEEIGVSNVVAEVYFDEDFSDVGVIGSYYVYGKLEAEPTS